MTENTLMTLLDNPLGHIIKEVLKQCEENNLVITTNGAVKKEDKVTGFSVGVFPNGDKLIWISAVGEFTLYFKMENDERVHEFVNEDQFAKNIKEVYEQISKRNGR